jgi:hypothetical protein
MRSVKPELEPSLADEELFDCGQGRRDRHRVLRAAAFDPERVDDVFADGS